MRFKVVPIGTFTVTGTDNVSPFGQIATNPVLPGLKVDGITKLELKLPVAFVVVVEPIAFPPNWKVTEPLAPAVPQLPLTVSVPD